MLAAQRTTLRLAREWIDRSYARQPLPSATEDQEVEELEEHHGDSPEDALVDVVRQYPEEAAWFIKVVMFLGAVSGILVAVPCVAMLWVYWNECALCNRPLRLWILVHCGLQLLQTPVRFSLCFKVHETQRRNGILEVCVLALTRSRAWQASKATSIVSYAWFVVGVVWLLNVRGPCVGLYRMCVAILVVSILRLILTLAIFRRTFPTASENEQEAGKQRPRGATQDVIDAVPQVVLTPEIAAEGPEASCAVCLCDFEVGDVLRRLPCAHKFHSSCVDKWLCRNKVCPLCVRDIEYTPTQSSPLGVKSKLA